MEPRYTKKKVYFHIRSASGKRKETVLFHSICITHLHMDHIVGEVALGLSILDHFVQAQNAAGMQQRLGILTAARHASSLSGMSRSVQTLRRRRRSAGIARSVSAGRGRSGTGPRSGATQGHFGSVKVGQGNCVVSITRGTCRGGRVRMHRRTAGGCMRTALMAGCRSVRCLGTTRRRCCGRLVWSRGSC